MRQPRSAWDPGGAANLWPPHRAASAAETRINHIPVHILSPAGATDVCRDFWDDPADRIRRTVPILFLRTMLPKPVIGSAQIQVYP